MKYVHLTGNEDLGYCLQEEILEYNEWRILYLLSELEDDYFRPGCGTDVVEASRSATRTAYVKGYVVRWKSAKDEKGADVSELEEINTKEQEAIKQLVQSRCDATFIYFE